MHIDVYMYTNICIYIYIHEKLPLVVLINMLFTNAKNATRNEQTKTNSQAFNFWQSFLPHDLMCRPQAMPLAMLV